MEGPTQVSTQPQWDDRRSGAAFSSPEYDDVICILHPSSAPAIAVTKGIWQSTPGHILQFKKHGLTAEGDDGSDEDDLTLEPVDGSSPEPEEEPANLDIALRTTAGLKDPKLGFVFGREMLKCDIPFRTNLQGDQRVSGMHFRIWVTEFGVLMLQDHSTNGTYVDDVLLNRWHSKRMLSHGAMIEVITGGERASNTIEKARFIVKLPQRGDDSRYKVNLRSYLLKVQESNPMPQQTLPFFPRPPDPAGRENFDLLTAGTARGIGMNWNGDGKYNCIGEIGKGAFAIVYKIATVDHGEIFAAKRIDKQAFVKHGNVDAKFYSELNIMKKVDHPHIVAFHDFKFHPYHLFIIMEFVPCGDMAPYIRKEHRLEEQTLQVIMKQLLHALEYIHHNGIVHRDIKPENILVHSKEPWVVKLSDFGLSKMIDQDEQGAMITFCGTLLYCAPEVYPDYEQMKNGGPRTRRHRTTPIPYSSAVDIWSLGSVLWYFLTFKPPYKGSAEDQGYKMLHSILYDFLDRGDLSSNGVTPFGMYFVTNMLNVSAQHRPSARELLDYEWLQDVADIIPVPKIEGTESFSEAKLETLKEEDENEGWPDDDANKYDESESFEKAAGGLLPDAISEVPGLTRDSTSVEDRAVLPQTERVDWAEHEVASYIANDDALLGQIDQASSEIDAKESTLSPQEQASLPAFRQLLATEEQTNMPPESNEASRNSNDNNILESSAPSIIEGWDQVNLISSSQPASRIATNAALPPVSAPVHLFGEITESNAHTVEESGVFGATQQPVIRLNAGNIPTGRCSPSSASLASVEQSMEDESDKSLSNQTKVGTTVKARVNMPLLQRGKRPRFADAANTDNAAESSSEGEPAAKKSMTRANSMPRSSKLATASDEEYSHSVSQGLNSLRLQGNQYGVLTPTQGSFYTEPLMLTSRITAWGREPSCTHVYPNSSDTRVPRNAMDIYFWCPGAAAKSAVGTDWRDIKGLHAVIMTRSRNGIKVNSVRLPKFPPNGPFKTGRLKTGDIIEIFNDGKSYLRYRCDFNLGDSAHERLPSEPFVVEDDEELYAIAVAGKIQA